VRELHVEGGCCATLDPSVRLVAVGAAARSSPVLGRAVLRAEVALRRLAAAGAKAGVRPEGEGRWLVSQVEVQLSSGAANESLDEETPWAYGLECRAEQRGCRLVAENVFGAVAALESTLRQLFAHGGAANFQTLTLKDRPEYKARGLMVDTGRRFIPKSVLFTHVIDGMALVRMNLLQLHLSDFCRFALELPSFPELRQNGFRVGAYSQEDIREIVAYALDRGIRVLPEVDLPGHAAGLLPLRQRGLRFCETAAGKKTRPEQATKIYDDTEGSSRQVIRQLLGETAEVFGPAASRWLHVGGDEASPTGACTAENIAGLEEFVVGTVVQKELGRTAVAWEELRLKDPDSEGFRSAGRTNDTIIMGWMRGTPWGIARRGHRVLAANLHQHYLDYSYVAHPPSNFWYDPSERRGSDAGSCTAPSWEHRPKAFLGGLPDPKAAKLDLAAAQRRCIELGFRCAGVTCKENTCSPREGDPFLGKSPNEESWLKRCPDDDAPEMKERVRGKLLGGVSAMWTDKYTYIYQCGAAHSSWGAKSGTLPGAALMFPRSFDASFGLSLAGMIWPRAAVSAATLWRYSPSVAAPAIDEYAQWLAAYLLDASGVASCPPGCACDELTACERPYPVLFSEASGAAAAGGVEAADGSAEAAADRAGAAAEADGRLRAECFEPASVEARQLGPALRGEARRPVEDALRLCFWRGVACAGVRCAPRRSSRERGRVDEAAVSCALHGPSPPGGPVAAAAAAAAEGEEVGDEVLVKRRDKERCAPDALLWSATAAAPPPPPPQPPDASGSAGAAGTVAALPACPRWAAHPKKFLGGYSKGSKGLSLQQAKAKCIQLGRLCRGITCDTEPGPSGDDGRDCTPRRGDPFLADTPGQEVSFVLVPC